MLFCRLGILHIEVEVEGEVGPSEGVVGAMLAQDQMAQHPLFVAGDVARVVVGTSHNMVLQSLQLQHLHQLKVKLF